MGFTSRRLAAAGQTRSTMEQFLIARHMGSMSMSGVAVTERTIGGLPAFDAAVGFAADAVAQLVMRVWRGEDAIRSRVKTTWQARLFRGAPNPTQNWSRFWYIVEASLTARRNAYIFKTKNDAGQVTALTALHPDQVTSWRAGNAGLRYSVSFADPWPRPPAVDGYGSVTVDSGTVLHIRGRGDLGQAVTPSPVREFAQALGLALGKQEHEASFYGRGAGYGLVVKFPANITSEKANEWRELFDSQHAGPSNTGRTKVIGGGAELSNISMTQAEAQFTESVGLSLADVARITNIPGWFLGAADKTSRPISPEHEMQRWMQTGLAPRLARIEGAINGDADFGFVGMGDYYAAFDSSDVVRGDRRAEDTIAHNQIQDGRLLVDEWRVEHGRSELPGGIGKVPQVTPVGGAPNDDPVMPPVSGAPSQ